MLQMELKTELLNLAKKWEEEAMGQVPDAYAVRYMHNKYFRLDNEAAGLWSCAKDLRDLLIRDAEQCVQRTACHVRIIMNSLMVFVGVEKKLLPHSAASNANRQAIMKQLINSICEIDKPVLQCR
jgi:hypothetical protein